VETYLERVPPAAWRVYATALVHRQEYGDWPSREVIRQLAESEGARFEVALVLTRFELFDAQGEPVPLDGEEDLHYPAVVPYDAHILWAILATRRQVFGTLQDERGHRIHHLRLESWANAWSSGSPTRLARS
jgi:hypothetical protein